MTTMAARRFPAIDLAVGAATTTAVAIMLVSFRTEVDDDLWLHLRIGEELRSGQRFGQVPDPLVVIADRPYSPTQWLSEVALSVIHDVAGLWGIHLLRALGIAALVLLTVATCRLLTTSVRAAIITLVVTFATSAGWAERPQMAGLVLHAACVYVWIRAWKSERSPWPAVPLLWLWACLHGTWILGVGVCLLGAAVITLTSGLRSRATRRGITVALGAAIAVLLTPAGPRLITQPFVVAEATQQVNEWQAPTADNPTFLAALLLVALAAALVIVRRKGAFPVALFGLAALALSLYAVRTVAFGAVLAGCAAAVAFGSRRGTAGDVSARLEVRVWLLASALIATGATMASSPLSKLNDPDLVSAVEALPNDTHIAVDPGLSGWTLFHAPKVKPLRDLRAEVYSNAATRGFADFWDVKPGWHAYCLRLGVDALLAPQEAPLVGALSSLGWKSQGNGDGFVLMTPRTAPSPAGHHPPLQP
jgi:hypothetical protein